MQDDSHHFQEFRKRLALTTANALKNPTQSTIDFHETGTHTFDAPSGELVSVYRDPSGKLEAVTGAPNVKEVLKGWAARKEQGKTPRKRS